MERLRTGAVLATFDADIIGGNLRLRATGTECDENDLQSLSYQRLQ